MGTHSCCATCQCDWHHLSGLWYPVMSHTWPASAATVTPDHVWHGLDAVHGCWYKCNVTAHSFHMASVWCRPLHTPIGLYCSVTASSLERTQETQIHLDHFCQLLDVFTLERPDVQHMSCLEDVASGLTCNNFITMNHAVNVMKQATLA